MDGAPGSAPSSPQPMTDEPDEDGRQQRDCDLHSALRLAWLDWRRFAQGQKTTQEEGLSTCKTEV